MIALRFIPGVPKLKKAWEDARGPLERYLGTIKRAQSGIPVGGFLGTVATTIQAGVSALAGTRLAGWAAADHVHDVETDTPEALSALGPANNEGDATALARADHVHDPTELIALSLIF